MYHPRLSVPSVRLIHECRETLPRLAWCASVTEGAGVVRVMHGPWVETWLDGFCEGAWDGPFVAREFAEAQTFVGSGGRITASGVLFASSTNVMSQIFSLRDGDRLVVSNSLPFVLAQASDSLDLGHPHYYFDFVRHKRRGLTRPTWALRTARGNQVLLHHYTNVLVRADLSLSAQPKNVGAPPADFTSYRDLLQSGVERVFANAADGERGHRYRPLATLSQGYDAPAVAALAARAGCRRALVCRTPPGAHGEQREDGALVARYLGLDVTQYDRLRFRDLPDVPEAESCAGMAFGQYVHLATVPAELEGTLLLTGHPGDEVWSTDAAVALPHLLLPADRVPEAQSLKESRLRMGFLWFPVPWIGAYHKEAIHRITVSREMKPWSVSGGYNRPIARRIAEEAGVPRALFGHAKMATFITDLDRPSAMTSSGRRDFDEFCRARVPESMLRRDGLVPTLAERRGDRALRMAAWLEEALLRALRRLPRRVFLAALPLLWSGLRDRRNPLWRSVFLYTFHWGVERMCARYRVAVGPADAAEAPGRVVGRDRYGTIGC